MFASAARRFDRRLTFEFNLMWSITPIARTLSESSTKHNEAKHHN